MSVGALAENAAYGNPMFANVVGASVKRTVFVKFATAKRMSLSVRSSCHPELGLNGEECETDIPKMIKNVHILSRINSWKSVTCCHP